MSSDRFDAARLAKSKVDAIVAKLRTDGIHVSVGLALSEGAPAVKVGLESPLPSGFELPKSVDGVPVVHEVVGRIKPLSG
jgi:hypothetical protein